jgi:Zn-finger nucleic acid-binding protein
MPTCPCCSTKLLRHARHNTIYWYCPHCREEMPDLKSMVLSRSQQFQSPGGWLGIRKQNSGVLVTVSA